MAPSFVDFLQIRGSIFFLFSFSWAGGLILIVMEDEEEESEGGRVQGDCFWKSIIIFSKVFSCKSAYLIWHHRTSELGFNCWPHLHLLGGPTMVSSASVNAQQ